MFSDSLIVCLGLLNFAVFTLFMSLIILSDIFCNISAMISHCKINDIFMVFPVLYSVSKWTHTQFSALLGPYISSWCFFATNSYGAYTGKWDVIQALVTLGFTSEQVIHLLQLLVLRWLARMMCLWSFASRYYYLGAMKLTQLFVCENRQLEGNISGSSWLRQCWC